jgi:membrane-associated phospholipid phosphatase
MIEHSIFRWKVASAACVATTLLSISYLDRPIADFFSANIRPTAAWDYLTYLLAPCSLIVVAALVILLGSGWLLLSGRVLPAWSCIPLLCSWSTMWALAAQNILKDIFGRSSTEPTYSQSHMYQFRYFHATAGWNSFPSGTAMVMTALAAVLWSTVPASRLFVVMAVSIVMALLIVTNGHWMSDLIAGGGLGVYIGQMTLIMLHPKLIQITKPAADARATGNPS